MTIVIDKQPTTTGKLPILFISLELLNGVLCMVEFEILCPLPLLSSTACVD